MQQFKRLLGMVLCWASLHDWYRGIFSIYCTRHGCDAEIKTLDFDDVYSNEP